MGLIPLGTGIILRQDPKKRTEDGKLVKSPVEYKRWYLDFDTQMIDKFKDLGLAKELVNPIRDIAVAGINENVLLDESLGNEPNKETFKKLAHPGSRRSRLDLVGDVIYDFKPPSNENYRAILKIDSNARIVYVLGIGSRKAFGSVPGYDKKKSRHSMLIKECVSQLIRGEIDENIFIERMLLEGIELSDINFALISCKSIINACK
jgi:hypothetical protein